MKIACNPYKGQGGFYLWFNINLETTYVGSGIDLIKRLSTYWAPKTTVRLAHG